MKDIQLDVLAALRASTGQLHSSLDKNLPIAQEHAGLVDYINHIQCIHTWMNGLLPGLLLLEEKESSLQSQSLLRIEAIQADLKDANIIDIDQRSFAIPELIYQDQAYFWGIAYVIEGSQLGGHILYKRLHHKLSPHPLRYFALHKEYGSQRWISFIAELRKNIHGPLLIKSACTGAVDAFKWLLLEFEKKKML